MSDLMERLSAADISGHGNYSALVREAKAEIERLRAFYNEAVTTIERLKSELEKTKAERDVYERKWRTNAWD